MSAERYSHIESQIQSDEIVPISEIEINKERANVLCHLSDIRDSDKKIPEFIVQQMLNKRRVGFIGGSGNGKTTALMQARIEAVENAKRLKIPFFPKVEFYDNFLPQRINGIEDLAFNKKLYTAFKNSDIFENPGVGEKNPKKDRGVTALEWMMLDMMEGRDDSLLVYITTNPKIQLVASFIRSHIANTPVDEVFNELSKMRVNLKGVPRTNEIAERIKETFGNMGRLSEMRIINEEQKNLMHLWEDSKSNELRFLNGEINHKADYFKDAVKGLLRPTSLKSDDIKELFKVGRKKDQSFYQILASSIDYRSVDSERDRLLEAIYMEDKLKKVWNLSDDQALIVHNNYFPKEIELDFSVFANLQN